MAVIFNQPAELPEARLGDEALWMPNDLENYLFHITFDFRKFTRRNLTDRNFYAAGSTGSVRLPIPANMIDTTAVNWGEAGVGPVIGAIIDVGARLKNQNNSDAAAYDQVKQALEGAAANAGTLFGAPIAGILSRFGGTKAAEAVLGVAINPFMTVMFQGPTFKRHQFQWTFFPHTSDETDTIRKILARFKFNMLPSVRPNSAGLLLNYPNMCYVSLHPNNKDLYKFKPCVITSASINYAPNGPSFFDGTNAPTGLTLTVDLLELEYWLQEDVSATWDTNLDEGGSISVNITDLTPPT